MADGPKPAPSRNLDRFLSEPEPSLHLVRIDMPRLRRVLETRAFSVRARPGSRADPP